MTTNPPIISDHTGNLMASTFRLWLAIDSLVSKMRAAWPEPIPHDVLFSISISLEDAFLDWACIAAKVMSPDASPIHLHALQKKP